MGLTGTQTPGVNLTRWGQTHTAANTLWAWPNPTVSQSTDMLIAIKRKHLATTGEHTCNQTRNMPRAPGTGDQEDCTTGHTGCLLYKAMWSRLGDLTNLPNT